jgi:hypothetical protein
MITPRGRAIIQGGILLGVLVALGLIFPRAPRFVEMRAGLRYFWWLLLLVVWDMVYRGCAEAEVVEPAPYYYGFQPLPFLVCFILSPSTPCGCLELVIQTKSDQKP